MQGHIVIGISGKPKFQKRGVINSIKRDRVYQFLLEYKQSHDGNSPTIREIGDNCGISSTSQVSYYLDRLQSMGLIRRTEAEIGERFRSKIEVIGGHWSFLGGEHG